MGWFEDAPSPPSRAQSREGSRGGGSRGSQSGFLSSTAKLSSSLESPEELLALAKEAFNEGDWVQAETAMEAAVNGLAAQSQYSEVLGTALTDLSRLYCDNMKFEEARDAAVQALGIADVLGYDTAVALSAMSRRLIAAVKLKERHEVVENLIQRALGWLLDLEAEEEDDTNVEIIPARGILMCTVAGCRRHQGKEEEAKELEAQFQQLCEKHPDFKTAQRHLALGRILSRQGKKRQALELFDLSKFVLRHSYSRVHPEVTGLCIEQAETWRLLGEFKFAEKCFDQALKGMVANAQCFTAGQVQWCRDHLRDCMLARKKATFHPESDVSGKKKKEKG